MAEIRFELNAVDRFSSTMGKARQSIGKISTAMAVAATAAVAMGTVVTKTFLEASTVSENYRVRLDALLGSTQEGARAFDEMTQFASQVPFEFEEIMGAATQLSGVLEGGVDEITSLMPLITDLATVSGLGIQQTTEQITRMFSAGAASADLFRERGITAMLGFEAGVAISAEDTKRRVIAAWEDTGSKFAGASKKMAETWDGQVSMIQDKWFLFRKQFMDTGMFSIMKSGLKVINKEFQAFLDDSKDSYKEWTQDIIAGIGFMLDAWNGLKIAWQGLNVVFQTIMSGWLVLINEVAKGYTEFTNLFRDKKIDPPSFLQDFADASKAALNESIAKLDKMAGKEPPSSAWKSWADKVIVEMERVKQSESETVLGSSVATNLAIEQSLAERAAIVRQYMDADTELSIAKWEEKREREIANLEADKEQLLLWREERFIGQEEFDLKMQELEIKHKAKLGDVNAKATLANMKVTKAGWQAQAKTATQSLAAMTATVASENKTMFEINKAASIANTIMSTYTAATNVFEGYSDIPIIGAALGAAAAAVVVAAGLARVSKIAGTRFNKAHGGLGFVPQESTFLLSQGERVLSPNQNADLTGFLDGQNRGNEDGGGESQGQPVNFTFHILENATNADALLNMDQEDIESIMEDKMIPAMNSLYERGIRARSVSIREG